MNRQGRQASGLEIARCIIWLAVGAVALIPAAGWSADIEISPPEVLAASCAACHGTDGASPGQIPSINRLNAADMVSRLKSFKSGQAEATVMTRIAKGYTDAEIEALARYFAALPR